MAIGSRVNEKRRFYAGDVFCQAVFATEQQWAVQYCQSSAGCVPDITCPLAGQDMAQECPRYVLLSGEPQAGEEKVDPTVLRWIQFTDVGGVILSIIFYPVTVDSIFLHEMSINTEQFQTKTESAKQIQIAGCLSSHVLSQLGSCKDCQGCGAHWIVVNVSERF